MPIRVRNKTNNAATFFGPHTANTSQFAPPTAGEAGVWLLSDIAIIDATQSVESALGPGNSRTLTFRNNITDTGTPVVLADPATSVRGLVGGTLIAAVGTATSSANLGRQLDGGAPPSEASRIAFFYLDAIDADRSWHGFGSPTFNQVVSGTPEYFGVDQNRTTTTESVARTIVPVPCTLERVRCLYQGAVGTDHELAIMVGGVATVIGTLTGAVAALYDFTPNLHLAALDEIDFRVVRTAGIATTMVLEAVVAFVPDTP